MKTMIIAMSPLLPITLMAVVYAGSVAVILDEKLSISAGYFSATVVLIWWIARKWQKIVDKLEALDQKVSSLQCVRQGECKFDKSDSDEL